jgi:hypothetical protein
VAIIDVTEQDCGDLLGRSLRGCPACDVPDCIILATMETYNLGDKLDDQTDPPADPTVDKPAKIARIDNRKGRQLLPSTQMLAAVVECLAEQGTGAGGQPGLPGGKGADGLGIDQVDAVPIGPLVGPGPFSLNVSITGVSPRVLHLQIPQGATGPTGLPGPSAIVAAGRFDGTGSLFPSSPPNKGGIAAKVFNKNQNRILYDVNFDALLNRTTAEFVVKGIVIVADVEFPGLFPVINVVEPNAGTSIRVRVSPPPNGKTILGFMLEITELKKLL